MKALCLGTVALASLCSGATAQTASETQTPLAEEDIEVVVVRGIRGSLNDALEIRRKADVILDGISADDIGSTPDLNLGEALQRIPGVQINRSDDRRDASISVRGLPSEYTKTTVMGQSIAAPTLGTRGSGNPFGIYDAAIFGGADVIKSFSADMPAGGLGSIVNLRIRPALSRKDGGVFRIETQWEESTEKLNPAFFLTGSKKFTPNFGVYGTLSYSRQNFRRDTIRINAYTAYSAARLTQLAASNPAFAIPATTDGVANQVVFPSEVRQYSRTSDGSRLSGAAGFEWRVNDNLNIRLDGIATRRELDEANLDILTAFASDTTGIVTPLSDPVLVGQFDRGSDGTVENVYVVNKVQASDVQLPIGNRGMPSIDESFALYPQVNFNTGGWQINAIGTISEALGTRDEYLYEHRIQPTTGRTDPDGDGIDNTTNGITAIIDTGLGNYKNYLFDLNLPSRLLTATGPYTVSGGNGTQARNGLRPENVVVTASGANLRVRRNMYALDLKAERDVNFGPFTTVNFGVYYSKEKARQIYQENANLGLQLNKLTSDIFKLNDAVTRGGDFFGSGAPNAELDNFWSVDYRLIEQQIFPVLNTVPTNVGFTMTTAQLANFFPELTPAARSRITYQKILELAPRNELSGMIQRFPLNRVAGQNFRASRENLEAFAQTKFDFLETAASWPVRGNLGLRYVKADLTGLIEDQALKFYEALGFTSADFRPGYFRPAEPAGGSYDALLPSANLIVDFSPKLVARAAYYETFEAFDMVEFSPAPTRVLENVDPDTGETQSSVRIDMNRFDLKPRSSKAFDLGVSYYNRRGNVVAIGYFHKTIENNIIEQNNYCPVGENFEVEGESYGPMFIDATGFCRISQGATPETANQRIVINRVINDPNQLKVEGVEFQMQQDFSFLPGIWQNFGMVFNATKVTSSGSNGSKLYGVADHTYNLIGYYEDDRWQARLAYNYASEILLEGGSTFTGSSSRVSPRGQLDFSGAYTPTKTTELRLEVYNITNSRREEFEGVEAFNRVADYDGITYSLSVTKKF
ncbi:TonB-dependent receptor [Asticcacaulis sp. SL142]|uniref:TonB-dependent receptor n=1 Tax=Asticcacaulis sp. SL142 TaxID=2995155 RepID=UPI00226D2B81|nr:TonB-dependent receptor [Asticcacaulis sp. SL142]WAC48298.1 TonB-dependent receptor [Asticcacaulis sp. SL142]